jgi:hypothetical protein
MVTHVEKQMDPEEQMVAYDTSGFTGRDGE